MKHLMNMDVSKKMFLTEVDMDDPVAVPICKTCFLSPYPD